MTIRRGNLVTDLTNATTSNAALSSTLSTLTADGASPTSAHVSSAASAFVSLSASLSTTVVDSATFGAAAATAIGTIRKHADAIGPSDIVTDLNVAAALLS